MGRFLISFVVSLAIPLVFSLFRRVAPRNRSAEHAVDDGRRLPYGATGACIWLLAVLIGVGGFFLLYGANRLWASTDRNVVLNVFPVTVIWCFLPAFAAMPLPWLIALRFLRTFGYSAQAAEIVAKGNEKMNVDCERVMQWLAWCTVLPLASSRCLLSRCILL
jgi:MFS family permease